jgi:hypothetical protein
MCDMGLGNKKKGGSKNTVKYYSTPGVKERKRIDT